MPKPPNVRSAMRQDKKTTSKVIQQKKNPVVQMQRDKRQTSKTITQKKQKQKQLADSYSAIARDKKMAYQPIVTNVGGSKKKKKKKKLDGETDNPYVYPPIEPDYSIPDPPPPPVRVPERDVVELADQSVDAATIQNLLFENIGANELTKFVRHDTVEGINPYYDIISNLSDIKRKFDPSTLVSLQKIDKSLFDIYPIKLQDKIPSDEYLADNNLIDYVYFNQNGDLVIEVVNMSDSELVEVEIDRNGTIYEVEEL